jgi:hypothetical protein
MAYIPPKDVLNDPEVIAQAMKIMSGDLDLSWMKRTGEAAHFMPSQPARGLTLDDINRGGYGPDRIPEIVRHNFSMAPRGAMLPSDLPSLGYKINRKSDVWSDLAGRLFEEGKSRRWAPAKDVPWQALESPGHAPEVEHALRQLSTDLVAIGLVCCDVPAFWEWRMNQEFHEVKYLLCVQMFDAARIAEAFRKRALIGDGSLGVECFALGELLKSVFESDTYPQASLGMNVLLMSFVQALGRHWQAHATNAADTFLGTRLAQDATRFVAYGVDHMRYHLTHRAGEFDLLSEHLDWTENALVGALSAREMIEPLVLVSGGFEPVRGLYERTTREYFERCEVAGLGDRRSRSPLPGFLKLLRD